MGDRTMRQKFPDIANQLTDVPLSPNSFSNYFTVVTRDGNWDFLSNRTIYINGVETAIPDLYEEYNVVNGDQWSLLAHKFYGDVDLWWIICKFNDIRNPLVSPEVQTKIKIPTKQFVEFVIQQMNIS